MWRRKPYDPPAPTCWRGLVAPIPGKEAEHEEAISEEQIIGF
jgi:hypothetical protein